MCHTATFLLPYQLRIDQVTLMHTLNAVLVVEILKALYTALSPTLA